MPMKAHQESRSEVLAELLAKVRACSACAGALPLGPRPILQLSASATILVASQAPGLKVHQSGVPFSDASGDRLRDWMWTVPAPPADSGAEPPEPAKPRVRLAAEEEPSE